MAVITLKIVVANLAQVMEHFDKLKIYRSTTGRTGLYTELTNGASRPSLVATESTYDYEDLSGDPTYWYKISYFSTSTGLESTLSEPQQGEGDSALDLLSVEELKTNFLFGVDLTKDDNTPYPNSLFEFYIKSAVSFLEQELDMPLRPTTYEDERHDYYANDYSSYIALFLNRYPVISLTSVRFVLPNESQGLTYDPSWLHLDKEIGHLNIIPGSGGMALSGAGHFLLRGTPFIPGAFRVNYTAGFESGKCPANIRELIGKIASYGPLNIAGDLVAGAGLAGTSLSIDGLSQSITTTNSSTNAGYGARLIMYRKEVKDQLATVRSYYKGVRMQVA